MRFDYVKTSGDVKALSNAFTSADYFFSAMRTTQGAFSAINPPNRSVAHEDNRKENFTPN